LNSVTRFVRERETVHRRMVNTFGPRSARLQVCVTPRAKERLVAIAKHWQSTPSTVAGEVLEALVDEVWVEFTRVREGVE
jgi:hypothetical protein